MRKEERGISKVDANFYLPEKQLSAEGCNPLWVRIEEESPNAGTFVGERFLLLPSSHWHRLA